MLSPTPAKLALIVAKEYDSRKDYREVFVPLLELVFLGGFSLFAGANERLYLSGTALSE